jgi:hypothetical protein
VRGDEEGTPDLLGQGSEREPWRPPRRVVVPVAVLLVVVTAVVSGASRLRHQRDLDHRAAKAVAFLAMPGGASVDSGFELRLVNLGPAPVRLLDAALVGSGYPPRRVDRQLRHGDEVDVVVPHGEGCDATLISAGPSTVLLHARTPRGALVTRTVALDPDTADEVARAERERCGFLAGPDAVFFGPSEVTARGRTVMVSGTLQNSSNRPVTVLHVTAGAGLAVSTRLPITAAATVDGHAYPEPVTFTLRVTDCDAFARAVGSPFEDQPDQLLAQVRNDYGEGSVRFELTLAADPEVGDPGVMPLPLLARSCPGLVVPTP